MARARRSGNDDAPPGRHTHFDDAQALVTGTLFIALGVVMFKHAGLLTGGTAGLAFLAHYATGIGNGKLFFAINNTWQNSGDPAAGTNAAFTSLSGAMFLLWGSDNATRAASLTVIASYSYSPPSGFTRGW